MPGLLTIKFHIEFIFHFLKSEIDANLFTITQVKQQSFAFNKTFANSSQNSKRTNITHCSVHRAGRFAFGLSLSRQILVLKKVVRYQKKNNCKSPNFTVLKIILNFFIKRSIIIKRR